MVETSALTIDKLTRSFGGLIAVDNISVAFEAGRLNAIIGPNGAGKTTLFNLICGELRPDSGQVSFNGQDIAGRKPHEIVRYGISRTLQIKSIFAGLTVRENICAAVMSHEHIRSFFHSARSYKTVNARVDALIEEVGLSAFGDRQASTLSYGDIALLELALALANRPKLLLLDEPVCGMGPEETERTVEIIRDISKQTNVILIEHDMEVVFAVADEIVVMAQGSVLARGTPQEISANSEVQEAYLGAPDDED